MARTPDTNLTVDEFENAQRAVITTWDALGGAGLSTAVLRRSAAAALSSSATNWEWFRSEWHKKAIARDATAYRRALVRKLRHYVDQDTDSGRDFLKALDAEGVEIDVRLRRVPTLSTVSHLIDPGDRNVSFTTREDSDRKADGHLTAVYARYPKSLDRDDWLVLGVLIGVRNVLAHASLKSVDSMNDAISACRRTGDPGVRGLGVLGHEVGDARALVNGEDLRA